MVVEIPKDKERKVLEWFDSQIKNPDGSVTIKHGTGQSFPPELIGISREQLNDIPKMRIGARISPEMINKIKCIKKKI